MLFWDRVDKLGLEINRSKTKGIIVDRNSWLNIANGIIVEGFDYLGSLISNDGGGESEI